MKVEKIISSPAKRKGTLLTSVSSPPKIFKTGNPLLKSLSASSKRLAFESPASYQKSLSVSSPFTYRDRTAKQQVLSDTANLTMDESFGDIDCSLIERDAIAQTQSLTQTQKNLAEIFGNEEDSFGDLTDDVTDDELAEAVR